MKENKEMRASWRKYTLQFKVPAGTSRGVMRKKESWFLDLEGDDGRVGTGECGLLKGLSHDDRPEYEEVLTALCENIRRTGVVPPPYSYWEWPSIRFGLEMALRDLEMGGKREYFASPFTQADRRIPINGLIWMGTKESMLRQVREKVEAGFTCLKMKVGAIDLEEELEVLRYIRTQFGEGELVLRVDANGAFRPEQVPPYLDQLAALNIHSIEQPIQPGQWDEMAQLICDSPIPIALDEELIPLHDADLKREMLEVIRPPYIILKPSFTGGFAASEEWIALAEERGIGWWVTSALESNIGLNAIAQWTATLPIRMHQGLGTGALYTNNFPSPLYIEAGQLCYTPNAQYDG